MIFVKNVIQKIEIYQINAIVKLDNIMMNPMILAYPVTLVAKLVLVLEKTAVILVMTPKKVGS